MDFFERAHIVKKDTVKKDNKSEEHVKKQLKQMLHGYKSSDNKIIKLAGSSKIEYDDLDVGFDDSTSVSGFSDLNLTESSTEANKSQELTTDDNTQGTEEIKSNSSLSNEEIKQSLDTESNIFSEYYEDNLSSTENTQDNPTRACSDNESLPLSDIEMSTLSESICSDSDEFDPNGLLAAKILTNLQKQESINNLKKRRKGKKRKLASITAVLDEPIDSQESNVVIYIDSESVYSSQDFSINSSPYISITADDMPDQSLSEILGDYRYPTVKNLPSDRHTVNISNIFPTKKVESAEILVEDDVDSLIPEIGDEPTIDDLETTDLDLSLQLTNDNTLILNDTLQSELTDTQDSILEPEYERSVKVYHGESMCVFVMRHPSIIYINGKVKIKALGGSVEVFGYKLKDKYCDLYAPNYSCTFSIKTVESTHTYYGLLGKLTGSGLSVKDAEEIVTTLGECDGVLILSKLKGNGMNFVEDNFKILDLFSRQNKYIDSCLKKASDILDCTLCLRPPLKLFEVTPSWRQVIDCGMETESRTLVCGGKDSGKSTFLRYFVNKLLAKGPVLVIDLDPGQAEFTVAGHLSATVVKEPLLGPSFTHLTSPDLMLNIGMISTMDNPFRYIKAVADLVSYCDNNTEYRSMPWIINTMGMTNNLGLKFIVSIIAQITPTFVLQIDSKVRNRRYEVDLHPVMVLKLFKKYRKDRLFNNLQNIDLNYRFLLSSPREGYAGPSLAAKDARYLNILAYFGQLLNIHKDVGLLSITPYQVKLSDINIATNVKIAHEAVAKVINGKIIALCQLTTSDKGRVFILADCALRSIGNGLVRGVDFEKGVVYVLTPVPLEILSRVNTLLYCDWVPELRGEERNLPPGTTVPYRSVTVLKQKHHMIPPKRRYNPLQLLKVSGMPKKKPPIIS